MLLGIGFSLLQNADPLQCFRYIVSVPPTPLTEEDIWFQIGHVHEQQKDVRQLLPAQILYSDNLVVR